MESKITDKQRAKILKNFEERQAQLLLAKKRSKKIIRKLISTISNQNPSDVVDELKEELSEQFKDIHPDETTTNLFYDSDPNDESDSS